MVCGAMECEAMECGILVGTMSVIGAVVLDRSTIPPPALERERSTGSPLLPRKKCWALADANRSDKILA